MQPLDVVGYDHNDDNYFACVSYMSPVRSVCVRAQKHFKIIESASKLFFIVHDHMFTI